MVFWKRLSRGNLHLDGTEHILKIDRAQVEQFYLPLAKYLLSRKTDDQRSLIGVAGPPGCGKSAFATLLAAVINAWVEQDITCVVGMDGWHYPNAYLDSHFIERGGQKISLRAIKGAPQTFDVQAMQHCLTAIRQGGEVSYPVYSRHLHDPIPAGSQVQRTHQVVIVEGNYLFLAEQPWYALHAVFDIRIFLQASLTAIQAGLLERHLRGGKSLETAQRQIREVDLPNAERVLSGSIPASIIVHKLNSNLIQWIEYSTVSQQ